MWQILEHRRVDKQLEVAPLEVLKRYEKWKDIAALSGPPGLRLVKGFHDEALPGQWQGHRSSRLGLQWRVIYRVVPSEVLFQVASITAHDYRRPWMKDYRPAKKRVSVSVGESVRIMRELQELSQNQLASLSGIPQTTISAIENGRVRLGVERAKALARALKCHPGVLVFPGWELSSEAAA
jgi:DNA-binding XRE family transcriptional regulator/mRNA-degrading endonuclease YafQ of YafQ-DinJ toxin-antitoxin module